ncbi:sigma-70 family RNA polymerase sigma factor [Marinobacter sp. 71-i]|uniref:Sigma-70 family RNA polymerase sigma factor n=1 Tax=Marinobacter iranensis TaxID=2962607 RepID=A0ABT5Y4T4_9GAMM|nr:sigma-70 family RNA polymerase sigma factor [Marinobacter iranensis]MDF0748685.1 sigma-70 family RNA polymerase sigma factor [Marinobacter iranensis]
MPEPFSSSTTHRAGSGPDLPPLPASATELGHLLQRVATGDRSAFAKVYEATVPKLLGTVLRILNNRGWAEEVVHDVYIKIWQKAGQFDAGKASPITWMVTIARNSAIDELRKQPARGRAPEEELEQVLSTEPNAQSRLEDQQTVNRLNLCLEELEKDRRDMVRMAYLNGWSRVDLATHFDQPVNTIKTWLHRALKQLKGCLSP